jgi:hypothetical protein
MLTAEAEREARANDVPILVVDRSHTIDQTVAAVEALLARALAAGPRAQTIRERRAPLREANVATVEQVRAFYARPWAEADADSIDRAFICECGERPARRASCGPSGGRSRACRGSGPRAH